MTELRVGMLRTKRQPIQYFVAANPIAVAERGRRARTASLRRASCNRHCCARRAWRSDTMPTGTRARNSRVDGLIR